MVIGVCEDVVIGQVAEVLGRNGMEGCATVGVLAGMAEVRGVPEGAGGALWRLDASARQLDANIVRVPAGERVAEHVEPDLDVLLCVVDGDGELETAAGRQRLEAGAVAWLPRGARRGVEAGPGGLVYVTAHRRRPGLTIRDAPAEGFSS
ncbi:cupin domain-containing protein [Streptomyces sp. NPDC001985]|uniref:cupin domain-containing protein n=1 Tax=Streptomyces sp. NPDC001985 TaxID=3154406 RepID=UPI00331D43C9